MKNCQHNKGFKAGFAQIEIMLNRPDINTKKIISIIKSKCFDLLVFPELSFSGYELKSRKEAERSSTKVDSAVFDEIASICVKYEKAVIIGFAEDAKDGLFNSSLLIDEKGRRHVYRKAHLFNTEKKIFDRGKTGFSVRRVKDANVAQLICFDWFFPEASRTVSLMGADIIALSANLVMPYCQDAMVTRSLENRVFSIVSNRIGQDREIQFTGRSRIISPWGRVVRRGYGSKECVMLADIDVKEAREKRVNPENDLFKDRRGDLYVL